MYYLRFSNYFKWITKFNSYEQTHQESMTNTLNLGVGKDNSDFPSLIIFMFLQNIICIWCLFIIQGPAEILFILFLSL